MTMHPAIHNNVECLSIFTYDETNTREEGEKKMENTKMGLICFGLFFSLSVTVFESIFCPFYASACLFVFFYSKEII